MTAFVLIREDQNEHGYIDTSIVGIFRDKQTAVEEETLGRLRASADGLVVEDDDSPDGEWQVSWNIQEQPVRATPRTPSSTASQDRRTSPPRQ